MPGHYDTLGVAPSATAAEIRAAYLAAARRWHPDRFVAASPEQRRQAERSMQAVNEAWRVLGDPARRRAYDRPEARPTSTRSAGPSGRPTAPPPPPPRSPRPAPPVPEPGRWLAVLVVAGPIAALLALAAGIFVATALLGGSDPVEEQVDAETCVAIPPSGRPEEVPCDQPNRGFVVAVVSPARVCPRGTERYAIPGEEAVLCLAPSPGS